LDNVKAIRAVASANGKNNIANIVPWHRVIDSNQSLSGYAGGLWRKQWLLALEAKLSHGVQELFYGHFCLTSVSRSGPPKRTTV
jgi:methylated-DNA-[protein]-cysteine S-methyltransferase